QVLESPKQRMDFTEPPPISEQHGARRDPNVGSGGEGQARAMGAARSSIRSGVVTSAEEFKTEAEEYADGEENDRRGKYDNGKKSELRGHRLAHLPPGYHDHRSDRNPKRYPNPGDCHPYSDHCLPGLQPGNGYTCVRHVNGSQPARDESLGPWFCLV